MGIFFKAIPRAAAAGTAGVPVANPAKPRQTVEWNGGNPVTESEQNLQEVLDQGAAAAGRSKFLWGRLICATCLLLAIVAGIIYTAHDKDLQQLNATLLHSFEVLLGGLIGLILGESQSK